MCVLLDTRQPIRYPFICDAQQSVSSPASRDQPCNTRNRPSPDPYLYLLPFDLPQAYTGQKSDTNGLAYYGARYYDTALNRWTQADTVVADWYSPQSLNRYSYVSNNPLRYTDPTGHDVGCPGNDESACTGDSVPTELKGTPAYDATHDDDGEHKSGPAHPSYGQGDPCLGRGCYVPNPDNPWPFSRLTRTGRVLIGLSGSLNWFGGWGYGAGIEHVENMPSGQPYYTDGLFVYHGQSVTSAGASASAEVYVGGIFNYGADNPTYASASTAYQATACLGGGCLSITDTVNDTTNAGGTHANVPFAPGVSQSITVGLGPGVGVSVSLMRVNPILLLGRDLQ